MNNVLFSNIWVGLVSLTIAVPSPKSQKKSRLSPNVVLLKFTVTGPQSTIASEVNEGVGTGKTVMVSRIVSAQPKVVFAIKETTKEVSDMPVLVKV